MKSHVNWWGDKAGQVPLLTPAQEIEYAKIVQAWLQDPNPTPAIERKGKRAKEKMIAANLRLVIKIAFRYRVHCSSAISIEDLIQGGNFGLIRAVELFDPTRGYRFSTYATFWIQEAIQKELSKNGRTIRMPLEFAAAMARLNKAYEKLCIELRREPTKAELAERIKIPVKEIDYALTIGQRPASLNVLVGSKETTLEHLLSTGIVNDIDGPLQIELENRLGQLDPDLRRLIFKRYGVNCKQETIAEIAKSENLTICQTELKLKKARAELRSEAVSDPLAAGESLKSNHFEKKYAKQLDTQVVQYELQLDLLQFQNHTTEAPVIPPVPKVAAAAFCATFEELTLAEDLARESPE